MKDSFGFRKVLLESCHSKLHWSNSDLLAECSQNEGLCFTNSEAFRNGTRNSLTIGYSSFQHGRGVYLDTINHREHGRLSVFAKGIGWINGLGGWCQELGTLGVFSLVSAMHEVDVARRLSELSIQGVKPIAVWEYESLRHSYEDRLLRRNEVVALDGKPDRPAMFLYGAKEMFRLCDLQLMSDTEKAETIEAVIARTGSANVEGYLRWFAAKAGMGSAKIHSNQGHNYSAGAHNVFLDGTLVDFEGCAFEDLPAWDENLNRNILVWQDKELLGWWDALRMLWWLVPNRIEWVDLLQVYFEAYFSEGGNASLDMARYFERCIPSGNR